MSLQHAMYDRLQQAALEAEQERAQLPQGIHTMSQQEGQRVLTHIRKTPVQPRARTPLRTMTQQDGAIIQNILYGNQQAHLVEPPTPTPPIKNFLKKFLR